MMDNYIITIITYVKLLQNCVPKINKMGSICLNYSKIKTITFLNHGIYNEKQFAASVNVIHNKNP